MVERKKTGRAKARKRVSPINHFDFIVSHFLCQSTPGSNVEKSGEHCWISFLEACPSVQCGIKNKKYSNMNISMDASKEK